MESEDSLRLTLWFASSLDLKCFSFTATLKIPIVILVMMMYFSIILASSSNVIFAK